MNLNQYQKPNVYKTLRPDLRAAIQAVNWCTPAEFYRWQWIEEEKDNWLDDGIEYQIHTAIKISNISSSPVRMAVTAARELLKAGQLIDPFLADDGETEIPASEYEVSEDAAWHRAYRAININYGGQAVSFWLERGGEKVTLCVWHWLLSGDFTRCADSLMYLDGDATLDQIRGAFTLPYDRGAKWAEIAPRRWGVLGWNYTVDATGEHPVLRDQDGIAEPPSWLTTAEIAKWYDYHPASVTKAIAEGRLPAIKRGHTYLVRPVDVKSAAAEGRMKPRTKEEK